MIESLRQKHTRVTQLSTPEHFRQIGTKLFEIAELDENLDFHTASNSFKWLRHTDGISQALWEKQPGGHEAAHHPSEQLAVVLSQTALTLCINSREVQRRLGVLPQTTLVLEDDQFTLYERNPTQPGSGRSTIEDGLPTSEKMDIFTRRFDVTLDSLGFEQTTREEITKGYKVTH